MPAISPSSPMAARGRCTPSRSPARSASRASSSPPRPACSPLSACCSPTCATISCAPGRCGSRTPTSTTVERIYRELEDDGRRAVAETSVAPRKVTVKRAADMRYVGQEHAVTVDLPMSVFARAEPRRHQAPFRRDARAALRHLGARGARRDREPAHHRHRRRRQAGDAKDRPRHRDAAARRRSPARARSISATAASCRRRPFRGPRSPPATASRARRWSRSMPRPRC